jgi:hypothetical protein
MVVVAAQAISVSHPPVEIASAAPGQRLVGEMLVVEAAALTTRNGAPYLRALLRDRAGRTIQCRFWDFSSRPPASGHVVTVSGSVQLYEERLQLVLDSLRQLGPADPADWALTVEMPLTRRVELVRAAIDAIGHAELAGMVRWIFGESGCSTASWACRPRNATTRPGSAGWRCIP